MHEFRADAGGHKLALHAAVRVQAGLLEPKNLLHADDVALDAGDLLQAGDLALPVGQARDLDDHRQGGGNLLAQGTRLGFEARHAQHVFEPGERVARRVGVDGGHGAVVPGVHGLQHVEHFAATHLAHDDAVGPHAQAVAQQLTL